MVNTYGIKPMIIMMMATSCGSMLLERQWNTRHGKQ